MTQPRGPGQPQVHTRSYYTVLGRSPSEIPLLNLISEYVTYNAATPIQPWAHHPWMRPSHLRSHLPQSHPESHAPSTSNCTAEGRFQCYAAVLTMHTEIQKLQYTPMQC